MASPMVRLAQWLRTVNTNDIESLQNSGWELKDLVFGAVSPTFTKLERQQAVAVIIRLSSKAAIIPIFESILASSKPGSDRELNVAVTLAGLGKVEPLYRIRQAPQSSGAIPITLSWEVLPPGWWNDPAYVQQISRAGENGELVIERLRFVDNLGPLERYIGHEKFGNDPYWVFVFDTHVVAECPMEGNAIYLVTGTSNWRNLLSRSKMGLLSAAPDRVRRIVHRGDWKSRLKRVLRK